MKKRLISILLTICMVACLFSGLTVTAHAGGVETTEYILKSGDNVYSVCKSLGVDFHANYDWITKTNNIKNYSALPVGFKLVLPLGDTAGVTGGSTGSTGSNTGAASGNPSLKPQTGDKIVSYLIPHTVSYGETLYDLCVAKGINYQENVDYLLKLNGLKNANRIGVGRTLLFPSDKAPASGACIAVVSHKVVSGDATYNLCASYNIDYEDNLELMKVLNNKSNMASIKTGQNLLLPVATTVVPGSTGGNTGSTGGNTGSTGGNTGGSSGESSGPEENKPADTTQYKITQNTNNINEGSYSILVNNQNKSTAASGDTVTVNVVAKKGYKLDYVSVVDAKGNKIALNSTTFTMPASDVTISVKFVADADYKLTSSYAKNGNFTVTVNGAEVNKAAEGQTVKVNAEPAYGYELDTITVTRSTNSATTVAVKAQSFVMPKYDVTISVTFRKAASHGITLGTYAYGTFTTSINGKTVTEAMAGDIVKIDTKPLDGYAVSKITVTGNGVAEDIEVNGESFVMPAFPVKVEVKFSAESFNIKSAAASNGSFSIVDGSDKVISSADTGAGIYVKPEPAAGYVIDKVSYTGVDGNEVAVNKTGEHYYFTMPTSDITVKVTFKTRVFYLKAHADSPAVTFSVGGKEVTSAKMGETVTVNGNPAPGVKVKEIKAYYTSSPTREIAMTSSNTLVMPATNVTFKVVYELKDLSIKEGTEKNGTFSFKLNNADGEAITTAKMGQTVYVATKPASGYSTSKITVTDADGVVTDITAAQTFTMPSSAVTVKVTFAKNS